VVRARLVLASVPARRAAVLSTLDLIVQPALSPRESLAADRQLLEEARTGGGALRVYALSREVLSLGRYHLAPEPPAGCGVELCRRRSGGRAMPWGEGFVGLSLVLPHRAALVASDPLALAPDQVMNRYVRGILEACELSGVPALYPGRDVITVQRRILAVVSFDVEASGALVFEAVIASGRDFSVLPGLLDRADPGGVVKAGMLTEEDTTSLARLVGRAPDAAEAADRLRRGYEQRLGVRFRERTLALEADFDETAWLGQRRLHAHLDRHAAIATQLGVLEAHLALAGGRIEDAVLAGDFIANSPAIERLEGELRGCRAEPAAVGAAVAAVFGEPENFILGVGPVATVAQVIARALAT
jgi:lipoate-protein ligase A